jgi:hypothetical protein
MVIARKQRFRPQSHSSDTTSGRGTPHMEPEHAIFTDFYQFLRIYPGFLSSKYRKNHCFLHLQLIISHVLAILQALGV